MLEEQTRTTCVYIYTPHSLIQKPNNTPSKKKKNTLHYTKKHILVTEKTEQWLHG
jgi:hypothetical protein